MIVLTDFPITRSAIAPSVFAMFARRVDILRAAHKAGTIKLVDYNGIKSSLNSDLSYVFNAKIGGVYLHSGKWEQLPNEVYEFQHAVLSFPYLHTLAGKLKKAEASKLSHPLITDAIAIFREWLPLVEALADLKTKVTKREVKPVEEYKPGYHPPIVDTAGQRVVLDLLEDVTQGAYDQMLASLIDNFTTTIEREFAEFKASGVETLDAYYRPLIKMAGRDAGPIVQAYSLLQPVCDQTYRKPVTLIPDWKERVIKKATRIADDVRRNFVYKNYRKIASIVDGKDALPRTSVVSRHVSLSGLTGVFLFEWEDGSKFTTSNSVKWNTSVNGTSFQQFPLTFHDVKLPGGKSMGRPSEERMNTVFLGKEV